MDWEQWLRTAAQPPSENEEAKREKTETEIKAALAAYAPLKGKRYVVYVKARMRTTQMCDSTTT